MSVRAVVLDVGGVLDVAAHGVVRLDASENAVRGTARAGGGPSCTGDTPASMRAFRALLP